MLVAEAVAERSAGVNRGPAAPLSRGSTRRYPPAQTRGDGGGGDARAQDGPNLFVGDGSDSISLPAFRDLPYDPKRSFRAIMRA